LALGHGCNRKANRLANMTMESAVNSSASNPAANAKSPRLRSRVSNGKRTFVEGDGRSPWARRWRDLIEAHVADMGGIASVRRSGASLKGLLQSKSS
jgi:hypothetical protein